MDLKRLGQLLIPVYLACIAFLSTLSYQNTILFPLLILVVFAIYFTAVKYKIRYPLPLALFLIIGTRIPFFFNLPMLSDDFYRFIWDGMLLNEGINPIGRIPINEVLNNFQDRDFARLLLENMNSPGYASVYPPFHQLFFGVSYFLSGAQLLPGVNLMRGGLLTIELLTFLILLLRRNSKEQNYFFAYLLNPLVIIEGVGNIHFEACLVPFLIFALIDFSKKWYLRSSMPFAGSILIKLRSAILTPVFFFRYPRKKRFYFLFTLLAALFVFFGMLDPASYFQNTESGIGLFFLKFEFNASFYYLIGAIAELFTAYNPIAILAPVMAVLSGIAIVLVSYVYRRANIFEVSLVAYLIFLLSATTVHPWYIIPVVYLAIRSDRQYILIWSLVIFLSYSRYLGDGEPKWILLTIEYFALFAAIGAEGLRRKWLQPVFRG